MAEGPAHLDQAATDRRSVQRAAAPGPTALSGQTFPHSVPVAGLTAPPGVAGQPREVLAARTPGSALDALRRHNADRTASRSALVRSAQERTAAATLRAASTVIRRAMGLEAEMHRAVQTPGGRQVDEGDTPILKHSYFKLVTDHYKGYSNLEFVMNHFDQLAGTEPEAIAELGRRITAMSTLAGQLYAGSGRLGTMIGNITPAGGIAQPADIYKALAVRAGSSTDLLIGDMPAGVGPDDGKLYVHYTVGVRPQDWAKMVRDVESVSRPDTHNSRPKAYSKAAREIAAAILANTTGNPGPWRVEVEGHLALLYMQMGVFIDKCLGSLPHKELKSAFSRATYVRDVDKLAKVNVALKTATRQEKPALTDRKKVLEKRIAKQEDAKAALRGFERYVLPFSEGQQKNKILALPRAPLADAYSMLSERSQRFLSTSQEGILDRFTEKLQATMRLDFTENQTLKNKITIGDHQVEVETSLIDYLKAGLGSGQVISQQVLFGGMNEVGVDRTNPNALLLPFEFRKVFGARVTWAELTADATKVLKWSRDPQRSTLA